MQYLLNKIMTMHEECINYDFAAPLMEKSMKGISPQEQVNVRK